MAIRNIEPSAFIGWRWIGKRQGTLVDRDLVEGFLNTPADYRDFVWDFLIMRELPVELGEYLEDR